MWQILLRPAVQEPRVYPIQTPTTNHRRAAKEATRTTTKIHHKRPDEEEQTLVFRFQAQVATTTGNLRRSDCILQLKQE
jgi:hypothetical protein